MNHHIYCFLFSCCFFVSGIAICLFTPPSPPPLDSRQCNCFKTYNTKYTRKYLYFFFYKTTKAVYALKLLKTFQPKIQFCCPFNLQCLLSVCASNFDVNININSSNSSIFHFRTSKKSKKSNACSIFMYVLCRNYFEEKNRKQQTETCSFEKELKVPFSGWDDVEEYSSIE